MSNSKPRRRRTSHKEQYQFIMECRTSGLSDQQWCLEKGIGPSTFYNWVSRLRKQGSYDIPESCSAGDFSPTTVQDVVKLEMLPDKTVNIPVPQVEKSYIIPSIEISIGATTVRISNDVEPTVLSQVMRYLNGGASC